MVDFYCPNRWTWAANGTGRWPGKKYHRVLGIGRKAPGRLGPLTSSEEGASSDLLRGLHKSQAQERGDFDERWPLLVLVAVRGYRSVFGLQMEERIIELGQTLSLIHI